LQELNRVFDILEKAGYGEYLELDLSVVRGLAYYTGVVFEVYDKGQNLRAIAGGGRYDNLLSSLGGPPLSGVGFGMGDVVLMDLLREKNRLPSGPGALDYFLVDVAPSDSGLPRSDLLRLAGSLRGRGLRVTYALSGEKMKKQMAQADDLGARRALFFGSDRAPAGSFEVKDLGTGEQRFQPEGDL
jgi:histidyl-tRNA synthetase